MKQRLEMGTAIGLIQRLLIQVARLIKYHAVDLFSRPDFVSSRHCSKVINYTGAVTVPVSAVDPLRKL